MNWNEHWLVLVSIIGIPIVLEFGLLKINRTLERIADLLERATPAVDPREPKGK